MKIALIGGGGPRTVYFTESLIKYAERLGITELCLMDTDALKLKVFGGICRGLAEGSAASVTLEDDFRRAVKGARAVVFAIRVGGDDARVDDERIALSLGLIGQETTGAGGFAYAMRTVPVMLNYMSIVRETAPTAVVFNFTNPSGLVTQALYDAGFDNVYGICDNATGIKIELSKALSISSGRLRVNAYGLNHLSWANAVNIGGVNILPELLKSETFVENFSHFAYFDRALIKSLGEIPNGYLYYYYHREKALANMLKSSKTRGESIRDINILMLDELSAFDVEKDIKRALDIFRRRMGEREGSYMKVETGGGAELEKFDPAALGIDVLEGQGRALEALEGYAGVAFNCIESMTRPAKPVDVALNVPNKGAIEGMETDDIVEVTCDVTESRVKPEGFIDIPPSNLLMMKTIKRYEKLTIAAIREWRREFAYEALTIHPLVGSYSLAKELVNKYLGLEKNNPGDWK
jgi:6-phospho-beta-glucosidase